MIQLDYFLFCEDVIVDTSGKTTIVGVFDTIGVTELPVTANVFKIAFSFVPEESYMSGGVIKIKILVNNPEGKQKGLLEVEAAPKDVTFKSQSTLATSLDISSDFIINTTGTYSFNFYVKDELVFTRKLRIIREEQKKDLKA